MLPEKNNKPAENGMPLAETGNASNLSPHTSDNASGPSQLLGKEAERYLREGGNIEDMPDATDEPETNQELSKEV